MRKRLQLVSFKFLYLLFKSTSNYGWFSDFDFSTIFLDSIIDVRNATLLNQFTPLALLFVIARILGLGIILNIQSTLAWLFINNDLWQVLIFGSIPRLEREVSWGIQI